MNFREYTTSISESSNSWTDKYQAIRFLASLYGVNYDSPISTRSAKMLNQILDSVEGWDGFYRLINAN